MKQINTGTGYRRTIMRRANPHYVAPVVVATAVAVEAAPSSGLPEPPPTLFSAYLKTIALEHFVQQTLGTHLNHEAKGGGTLLTWAAEMHRADLCASLLDRGADANLADWTSGHTALQWAESTVAVGEEKPPCDRAATVALLRTHATAAEGS